jgi:hypothetical protein
MIFKFYIAIDNMQSFDLRRAITLTKMVRSPLSKCSWSCAYKLLLRTYGQHEHNVFLQTQDIIMTDKMSFLAVVYSPYLYGCNCWWPWNLLIGGVMVGVLVSSAVDRWFEPRSGKTKDYKIGICCFSTKHGAFIKKSKDWLARNQNNVSEWGDMSIHGLFPVR